MKKGFTLAELLGVTVLLALITVVSYPVILNMFEKKQGEIDSSKKELIENVAINYAKSNLNEYPFKEKKNSCIFVKVLVDNNLISYEVDEDTYNRIVKVNFGVNNKYTAELLDEGATCKAYDSSDEFKVITCRKNSSTNGYNLIDKITSYYKGDQLLNQIHKIKAENVSDLKSFEIQMQNYEQLFNSLRYTDGIDMTFDKNETYFEMYVEFDMTEFTEFSDEQQTTLSNAAIFYNFETNSLVTCD